MNLHNPRLTHLPTLKQALTAHDISPNRTRGQNFLISEAVVDATVAALESVGVTSVTELGSGAGTLTQALLAAGFTVRAIEIDTNILPILRNTVAASDPARITIVGEDLRTTPWEWDKPYQLAGNIPYNLSGFIIRRLVGLQPAPVQAVLLTQKEVAERIVGKDGLMSLPRLSVELWGQAQIIKEVPPDSFWPQPKVTSALLRLTPKIKPELTGAERESLLALARGVFQKKRKQILPTLSNLLVRERDEVARLLKGQGIGVTQRPEELSVLQWVGLWRGVGKGNDQFPIPNDQ